MNVNSQFSNLTITQEVVELDEEDEEQNSDDENTGEELIYRTQRTQRVRFLNVKSD